MFRLSSVFIIKKLWGKTSYEMFSGHPLKSEEKVQIPGSASSAILTLSLIEWGGICGFVKKWVGPNIHTYTHTNESDYLFSDETIVHVIRNNDNGTFSSIYIGQGIGGYSMRGDGSELFVAFDFTHSGKRDHLVLYVPGTGILRIFNNTNGSFSCVYQTNTGIGNATLNSTFDRVLAFDYDGIGKLDHLCAIRPGTGGVWIFKNVNGTFVLLYESNLGFDGLDLSNSLDSAFAFDFTHSGRLDHLMLYSPGRATVTVVARRMRTLYSLFMSQKRFLPLPSQNVFCTVNLQNQNPHPQNKTNQFISLSRTGRSSPRPFSIVCSHRPWIPSAFTPPHLVTLPLNLL